ncbi:MAG TPA: T9SS type A sorting domain-containing protein [Flavobacteriales bacterium]|nr:T9SS type A sorting domain-containing protein [Flavobacteriales bacterium]
MRHYELNAGCSNVGADVIKTADGGIVTWGYTQDFFALKVDGDLEPIWARTFDHHGGIQFIKELPGGDLLAGINMDTAGAVVARLDANGGGLWCKSYIRPEGMVHDAVIESDDSFIVTGYTDSIHLDLFEPLPPDFHPKLFMMKLDGEGEVQWCRGYEAEPNPWYTTRRSRIERTVDGNYAILANLGQEEMDFFYRPFLMKTDLNGDTLWTRSFGGSEDYIYETFDLLAHSDEGFVFTGSMMGELPGLLLGAPYIFKTDSEGHFPCLDISYPVTISELFPVDSSFTLTSVDGAIARPAFARDTVLDPFTVYDGCTNVLLKVPHVSGKPQRMSVYPNPTPGRFTVEFQDPLVKDSYYSVYDAMGKLLFQRAAAHGQKTEEVDLTGYSKGTYVIRFTDKEGTCYERVVVE